MFENISHKRIHDNHGLAGNSHIGMSLLQHLYIDHIAFLSLSLSPLGSRSHPGLSLAVVFFFFSSFLEAASLGTIYAI